MNFGKCLEGKLGYGPFILLGKVDWDGGSCPMDIEVPAQDSKVWLKHILWFPPEFWVNPIKILDVNSPQSSSATEISSLVTRQL